MPIRGTSSSTPSQNPDQIQTTNQKRPQRLKLQRSIEILKSMSPRSTNSPIDSMRSSPGSQSPYGAMTPITPDSPRIDMEREGAMDNLRGFAQSNRSVTSHYNRQTQLNHGDGQLVSTFSTPQTPTAQMSPVDEYQLKKAFRGMQINGGSAVQATDSTLLSEAFDLERLGFIHAAVSGLHKVLNKKDLILATAKNGNWLEAETKTYKEHLFRTLTTALKACYKNLNSVYESLYSNASQSKAVHSVCTRMYEVITLARNINESDISGHKLQAWGDLPSGKKGPFEPARLKHTDHVLVAGQVEESFEEVQELFDKVQEVRGLLLQNGIQNA